MTKRDKTPLFLDGNTLAKVAILYAMAVVVGQLVAAYSRGLANDMFMLFVYYLPWTAITGVVVFQFAAKTRFRWKTAIFFIILVILSIFFCMMTLGLAQMGMG